MNNNKYYTISEISALFDVTQQAVHLWIQNGNIKSHRCVTGKCVYFKASDIVNYLKKENMTWKNK